MVIFIFAGEQSENNPSSSVESAIVLKLARGYSYSPNAP